MYINTHDCLLSWRPALVYSSSTVPYQQSSLMAHHEVFLSSHLAAVGAEFRIQEDFLRK